MQLPLSWLGEQVELQGSVSEICDHLTGAGIETEPHPTVQLMTRVEIEYDVVQSRVGIAQSALQGIALELRTAAAAIDDSLNHVPRRVADPGQGERPPGPIEERRLISQARDVRCHGTNPHFSLLQRLLGIGKTHLDPRVRLLFDTHAHANPLDRLVPETTHDAAGMTDDRGDRRGNQHRDHRDA